MRILIRTSRWAIWARRLGSFALPVVIIPVLMHRAEVISTPDFEVVEAFGLAIALGALAVSIIAFARIWVTGDLGWGRAITGFLCCLVCLVPVAALAADYLLFPLVDEVTTDTANPPPLLAAGATPPISPASAAAAIAAFPTIKTRHYPRPADRIFGIIDKLAAERGWTVQQRQPPEGADGQGQLNAIAGTLLGFRDEVSIRIVGATDGSSVDMRSASLSHLHEPGVNGSRIAEFLTALDTRVTQLSRDQPAGTTDDDGDADTDATDPGPVIPAPAPRSRKH